MVPIVVEYIRIYFHGRKIKGVILLTTHAMTTKDECLTDNFPPFFNPTAILRMIPKSTGQFPCFLNGMFD